MARARTPDLPISSPTDISTITPADEEAAALRRFDSLQRLCDAAVARQDIATLPQLIKSAQEAHKLLEQVRRARLSHDEASGKLIPKDALNKRFNSLSDLVIHYLSSLASECSKKCNPADPEIPERILEAWAEKVLRALPLTDQAASEDFQQRCESVG